MGVLAGVWVAWRCRRVCGWHGDVGGCVGSVGVLAGVWVTWGVGGCVGV